MFFPHLLAVIRTSQFLALAVGDLSIEFVQGYFDVLLTLGDGAFEMFLNI